MRSLREGQTYSAKADPIAKLMLGLMSSVAEFERSIIKERQAEGIARAKARGVNKGRAKVLTDAQVAQARGVGGWRCTQSGGGPPARDWVDHLVQVPHKKLRVTISSTISDLLTFGEGDSISVRSEEVTRGSMCIFLNSMTLGRVRAYFLPGNEP